MVVAVAHQRESVNCRCCAVDGAALEWAVPDAVVAVVRLMDCGSWPSAAPTRLTGKWRESCCCYCRCPAQRLDRPEDLLRTTSSSFHHRQRRESWLHPDPSPSPLPCGCWETGPRPTWSVYLYTQPFLLPGKGRSDRSVFQISNRQNLVAWVFVCVFDCRADKRQGSIG